MTANKEWIRSVFSVVLFSLATLLVLSSNSYALIPEPDHILYGILPENCSTISFQIKGEVVTTYTKGDNPAAGDYFIMRIALDSVDPQVTDAFRPDMEGGLFLNAQTEPVQTITLGERGTTQRIFLPDFDTDLDTDLDGITDVEDNCPEILNYSQEDANDDGEGDACDGDSDTDGDGYNDKLEYNYIHSGRLDLDGYAYDPLKVNPPGDVGYVKPKSKTNILMLMMPIILKNMVEQQ